MILRDPVHGLVSFEGTADRVLSRLLQAKEVQRLRRVRQLGLTSLVFPGAEHSRLAHALGAAHLMVRLQERIRQCEDVLPKEMRMDSQDEAEAIAAALLHDLGHGPFSHLFEDVVPDARHHEHWTCDALLSEETEIHQALESLSEGMSERVVALLRGKHRLGYLSRAVSGTLDVDRADYLMRDSQMTGVRYGLYDLDWLFRALHFDQAPDGEWVLAIEGRKGLPPMEGFFLGRHFMYRQVYHHKATRAAECLVRALFTRMAELVREDHLPVPSPVPLVKCVLGERPSIEEYLEMDDAQVQHCFSEWAKGPDKELALLASQFRDRRLPKTLPLPTETGTSDNDPVRDAEIMARASEVAARAGYRPDLRVFMDRPSDTPFAEPDDQSAKGLWVSIRHQPIQRLGAISFLLGELRNKRVRTPRLIFPADIRGEVQAALEGLL